ncbi:MAG: FGGY-family carbohydrate kinase [Geminicoccaceae bacterium]
MHRDVIIGIDAGTSMIKAVAFAANGRQLATSAVANSYETLPGGGVEQDMPRTWADAATVLRRLAAEVPNLAIRTVAVAVTGQGDGTWLIDRDGEPVGGAWLWLDSRSGALVDALRQDGTGQRLYAVTGTGLNACQQSAHLLWLHRHQPERLARAATAFHCKDWLYFNLTGVRATDYAEGVFTFGDFRSRAYAPEVLDILGVPQLARLLPPLVEGSRESHPLSPAAAAATGLLAGTPVVLGYLDTVCTALGGGVYDPVRNVGCSVIGSTGMHARLARGLDDIRLNDQQTGYTKSFPVPGCWTQMQSNMAATLNIDWIVACAGELLAAAGSALERRDVLALVDARIAEREPGKALFHPFIYEAGERGPFVDPLARAQFLGLTTATGFFDLARAVYEGLAFAARDCYAAMGHAPEEIRITGGAARSATLRGILAGVLGKPVRRSRRDEAGAAGAAMMAAVQQGHFPDMAACCSVWVDPQLDAPEPPDPALAARYDALFPVYRSGYRQMRPVWRELDDARKGGAFHG